MVQLLCFGLAISGIVYFWRAGLGYLLLVLFTGLTLLSIGTTDSRATVFHGVVLLILLVPLITSKWKPNGEPGGAANGSQPSR